MLNQSYVTSPRRLRVPVGYKFDSLWKKKDPYTNNVDIKHKFKRPDRIITKQVGQYITISVKYPKMRHSYLGPVYAVFVPTDPAHTMEKSIHMLTVEQGSVEIKVKIIHAMPEAKIEPILIDFKCGRCHVQGILVRGDDGMVFNLNPVRYRTIGNDGGKAIEIELGNAKTRDFGTYMVTLLNDDGLEENIQALQLHDKQNHLKADTLVASIPIGEHVDKTYKYTCDGCEVADVTCNGESVTSTGRVSIVPAAKMIAFNFPSWEDAYACVYMGIFKKDDTTYRKTVAIFDTVAVTPHESVSPSYGEPYDFDVTTKCEFQCDVDKVSVNGAEIDKAPTRRSGEGPAAYYLASSNSIAVHLTEFSEIYEGVYMAVFTTGGDTVTKVIAKINDPAETDSSGGGGGGDGDGGGDVGGSEATTSAPGGAPDTAAPGTGPTTSAAGTAPDPDATPAP